MAAQKRAGIPSSAAAPQVPTEPGVEEADWDGKFPIAKLSYRVMMHLVKNGNLDKNWQTHAHTHLDFSDEMFNLETIVPRDLLWSNKSKGEQDASSRKDAMDQGMRGEVPVWKLNSLNISDNVITDQDFDIKDNARTITGVFFANLKTLKAKSNAFRYPVLLLPRLKDLNLSHNKIIRVPPLAGVPNLEILNLAHNQIEVLQGDTFQEAKNLKSIDLGANLIEIEPSKFELAMSQMRDLSKLGCLILSSNPFCQFFGEYQVLVVKSLPSLTHFDNLELLKDDLRGEMLRSENFYFGCEFRAVTVNGKVKQTVRNLDDMESIDKDIIKLMEEQVFKGKCPKDFDPKEGARKYFVVDRMLEVDKLVKGRREDHARVIENDASKSPGSGPHKNKVEVTLPRLVDMIKEFDEAIMDPAMVHTCVQLVFDLASKVSGAPAEKIDELFDRENEQANERYTAEKRKAKEQASATFVQQAVVLIERNEEQRPLLLRTLAKFSGIDKHRLGSMCLDALSVVCKAGGEPLAEVLDVTKDMIVPQINGKPMDDPSCRTAVVGLSKFKCDGLAECLSPITAHLCHLFKAAQNTRSFGGDSDKASVGRDAIVGLIAVAVTDPANADSVIKEGLVTELCKELCKPETFHDQANFSVYLDFVKIVQRCLERHFDDVMANLAAQQPKAPESIYEMIADLFDKKCSGGGTLGIGHAQQKKVGALFLLLADLTQSPDVLRRFGYQSDDEAPDKNRYLKRILVPLQEHSADPLVLTGALRWLTVFLSDREQRHRYVATPYSVQDEGKQVTYKSFIAQEIGLDKEVKLMSYLDDKGFKEMYRHCEEHSLHAHLQDPKNASMTPAPEFNGVTNAYAHEAIIALVGFIELFTTLGSTEKSPIYARISSAMSEMGREKLLFRLLEIPSDSVQEVIVRCIGRIPIADLDGSELGVLLFMLDPASAEGKESLLVSVLSQFIKLIEAEGEAGDVLKAKYARTIIHRTFEVLTTNAKRKTYGNEIEESQKLGLSRKCVMLMFSASQQTLLRKHFRGNDMAPVFRSVLKHEELENRFDSEDVCIELTWMGRNVEYLIGCLTSSEALHNRRKQSFRVLHRIADVLEGVGDSLARPPPISVLHRSRLEEQMWSEAKMRLQIGAMDESTYKDRREQQQGFVAFNGGERVLHYLEFNPYDPDEDVVERSTAAAADDLLMKLELDMRKPADDKGDGKAEVGKNIEVSMAEVKQRRETLRTFELASESEEFLTQVRGHAREMQKAMDAADAAQKKRDEPVDIELNVDIEDRGKVGEELLAEMYMVEGWLADEFKPVGVNRFSSPVPSRVLRHDERFYRSMSGPRAKIKMVFNLAAFLRMLYAILTVPAVERFRLDAMKIMRQSAMMLRVIALIEVVGSYVDCHIAAKFLRIMSIVLRLAPDQTVLEQQHEHLLTLHFASDFAHRCLSHIMPLVKQTGYGTILTHQQQTLALEAMRMLTTVVKALPVAVFSRTAEIQSDCLETVMKYMLPMDMLRCVFLCMLYDMQINVGSSHGRYINERYVRNSLERQGMRELCVEVFAYMMVGCKSLQYELIELFYQWEVFGKSQVRASCVFELMTRTRDLGDWRTVQESVWASTKPTDTTERILHVVDVDLPPPQGLAAWQKTLPRQPRMMVVTSKRIHFMTRPSYTVTGHVMQPLLKIGQPMDTAREYRDITRIVRGADAQMFVIYSVQRGMPPVYKVTGESYSVIICHRSNVRREVLDTFVTLSGPTVVQRVEACRDELIYAALQKRMSSPVVCVNYALRFPAVFQGPPALSAPTKMTVFVLSETEFCEFEVLWEHWIPPFDPGPDINSDAEAIQVDADLPDMRGSEEIKRTLDRSGKLEFQTQSQEYITEDADNGVVEDGPNAEIKKQTSRHTCWDGVLEADLEKITEDRDEAGDQSTAQFDKMHSPDGQSLSASDRPGMAVQAMRAAKAKIFATVFKANISKLAHVEFDPGQEPVLRLQFETHEGFEVIVIKFMDDVARERWRCGLAYVLNKADTAAQWHRGWEQEDAKEPEM